MFQILPTSRVFAVTITPSGGEAQNQFNTTANAVSAGGAHLPELSRGIAKPRFDSLLQNVQDVRATDGRDIKVADFGIDVGR